MDKKQARIRRSRRTRAKIRELGVHRLTIHRTPRHMYAQVIAPSGGETLASASTLDKVVAEQIDGATSNANAAAVVGKLIAERARAAGIDQVAFDRSGFRYHGRVKALADAAREAGLKI
ncbi:50S ribosomal protein L18 [endosymbiont of Ridgeia piscesae]|jgi:large subunit ribosomal protein L18|uniref:Large ribosomal subunit protein uL18 n=1 Tax=endosymbiont of Ridgeia piscesae TaxID=54398 RepID=A0A0T5Z3M5_9GAMM|nr:50S ribosomal protein L18 [endosymbiont of Ridgeia piscesae]KRT56479.1 LSU ribosomal protein L18P [endosymbiont of Ridgeia piscesae]KRT57495.1 LSU ribosomal protein L18P [endosymbiont of Ridgeia piscesae]